MDRARRGGSNGGIIIVIGRVAHEKIAKHWVTSGRFVNNNVQECLKLLLGRINIMEQAQHVMALSSVQWEVVSLLSSLDM